MADQEQVKLLKKGAKVWNKWRKKNPEVVIELDGALLNGTNLAGVHLAGAKLDEALLSDSNLRGANLGHASLSGSWLNGTDLSEATLCGVNFNRAELIGANLRKADLREANLGEAVLGNTIIAQVDLSQTRGLESVEHLAPSIIATDSIKLSKGEISEAFLRGCGLGDWEVESARLYRPGLSNQDIININYKIFDLRASQSIQISPLFISYSHADAVFVEKLELHLVGKGIRFWRDVHDMTSGRLEKQVDRAMRQNPTVILILSERSTRSDWVEHEARLARELEKELNRDVLCPIALDDSWKSAQWPARLMEQIMEYNILDYSNWKDDKSFAQVFHKMISGLDMFYKPGKEN
jgi:hypothetical protein